MDVPRVMSRFELVNKIGKLEGQRQKALKRHETGAVINGITDQLEHYRARLAALVKYEEDRQWNAGLTL